VSAREGGSVSVESEGGSVSVECEGVRSVSVRSMWECERERESE
jgi:hypothetical protein